MAIILAKTSDSIRVVWSGDPDVTPKDPEVDNKWLTSSEATAKAGADRLTVRPLSPRERFSCLAHDKAGDRIYGTCQEAVVAASNGKTGEDLRDWVDHLPPQAAASLMTLVLEISSGEAALTGRTKSVE